MYQYVLTGIILGICAANDIRYQIVYKRDLLVYLLLAAGGHLISGTVSNLEILYGLFPGIFCLLLSRFSRQAFGYGDSLLILIIGISLGAEPCTEITIRALFFSGLWALLLTAIKKENRKKEIPFVPFLLAGFLLQLVID